MKSIRITTAVVSLCALVSCNSLDLNPLSEGSSENWYSDESQIQMSITRLFNIDFWQDIQLAGGGTRRTDEWTENWTQRTGLSEITNATINSRTGFVVNTWKLAYKNIAAANLLIENISRAEAEMPAERLNMYEANARFSRASMYAKLIFFYGDVPHYTKNLAIDEFYSLSRTPKAEVLATIYEDYDFAIEHLPVSYASSEYQYATKGAAYGMKARIALYMGDYEMARDMARACIDLDQYTLYPSYEALFYPATRNTAESVFSNPRSVELKQLFPSARYREAIPRSIGGYNNGGPSWDLFCAYLCTDGLPIDESPLFNPQQPFENRDPRLTASTAEFGKEYLGIIYEPHPDSLRVLNVTTGQYIANNESRGVDQYASYNGLILKKGMDMSTIDWEADPENIVLRYADVLLMYAEAKIELNEVDQSVLDAMNQVRARAYGASLGETSAYPAIVTTDVSELRRILRVERHMEFAWEGTRYQDLIRWKLAGKVLNTPMYGMLEVENLREKVVKPGLWFFAEAPPIDEDGVADFSSMYEKGYVRLLATRKFDESRQYLWPIPATEIQINPNMKQNPGY